MQEKPVLAAQKPSSKTDFSYSKKVILIWITPNPQLKKNVPIAMLLRHYRKI